MVDCFLNFYKAHCVTILLNKIPVDELRASPRDCKHPPCECVILLGPSPCQMCEAPKSSKTAMPQMVLKSLLWTSFKHASEAV